MSWHRRVIFSKRRSRDGEIPVKAAGIWSNRLLDRIWRSLDDGWQDRSYCGYRHASGGRLVPETWPRRRLLTLRTPKQANRLSTNSFENVSEGASDVKHSDQRLPVASGPNLSSAVKLTEQAHQAIALAKIIVHFCVPRAFGVTRCLSAS